MVFLFMQALILAAGKSTRTYPLTITRPKPLLPLIDEALIFYTLRQLKGLVDEVLIVVGYQKEVLQEVVGSQFEGLNIRYIVQEEQLGTGHALLEAREHLGQRFMVINGDDIYHHEDLKACLNYKHGLLAASHSNPERFGVLKIENGLVEKINEKVSSSSQSLVNTGVYVLSQEVFATALESSPRGEYEITDYIESLPDVHYHVAQKSWIAIGYPWNFLEASQYKLEQIDFVKEGGVEEGAVVDDNVFVGKGSRILKGCIVKGPAYIGKNCIIGPYAYLRPGSIVLDRCQVGHNVEMVESVIMPDTKCKHRSYIGYSVIGAGCNLGLGFTTADFRHDGQDHQTIIKGKKVSSYRRKLGAFLGDNVRTGVGTVTYPGRKIWPGLTTLVGEIVRQDKIDVI